MLLLLAPMRVGKVLVSLGIPKHVEGLLYSSALISLHGIKELHSLI